MLNFEPSNLQFLKFYNIEFDEIVIKFTDQNGRPLGIEEKLNFTFFFLINRKPTTFYRTKKKKICLRKWIFIIYKKI